MNCRRFEAWLDNGRPDHQGITARKHAAGCPACGKSLEVSLSVDRLFEDPGLSVSDLFTRRVMTQVGSQPQMRPTRLAVPETPWWIEAWTEPTAALGLAALSLLTWQWTAVLSGVSGGLNSATQFAGGIMDASTGLLPGITGTIPVVTLTLIFGALLTWCSLALFRVIEDWMTTSLVTTGPTVPNVARSTRGPR